MVIPIRNVGSHSQRVRDRQTHVTSAFVTWGRDAERRVKEELLHAVLFPQRQASLLTRDQSFQMPLFNLSQCALCVFPCILCVSIVLLFDFKELRSLVSYLNLFSGLDWFSRSVTNFMWVCIASLSHLVWYWGSKIRSQFLRPGGLLSFTILYIELTRNSTWHG